MKPGPADIAIGISLYFDFCHRQPIWCFEREDVSDFNSIPEELACSLLALTARFSPKQDQLRQYGNNARHLIMLRIANGAVDIETIESLCLLSYSSFIGMWADYKRAHRTIADFLYRWTHPTRPVSPRSCASALSVGNDGPRRNICCGGSSYGEEEETVLESTDTRTVLWPADWAAERSNRDLESSIHRLPPTNTQTARPCRHASIAAR